MDELASNDPSRSSEPSPKPVEPAAPNGDPDPSSQPVAEAGRGSMDPVAAAAAKHWSAVLPPAPFVVIDDEGRRRMAPLSPRVAVLIGAAIVIGLVLWMARDAVRPFILGLLLVYLLDPPVRWLTRRGLPRIAAILLVYIVAIVAIVEFLNLTLRPLVTEAAQFIEDLPALMEQFEAQLERLAEIYQGLNLPPALREYIDTAIEALTTGEASFNPTLFLPVLTGATSFLGGIFGYFLLPVWAFYLLKDRVRLLDTFDRGLPAAWRPDTWATLRIVERVFGQWVRGQLLLGLTVGVMTFVGLMVLSVLVDPIFGRYAVLLSIIAGVLELLPIIGPIIAAVPAILLAATAGLEATVAAFFLYLAVQQLENYLLVPKIQGDAVQLHPAVVIFAIIIGGSLAGLLGAILALPVTAAARDVVRYLFRRLSPPEEAGSMEALGRDLGIEAPSPPPALSDRPTAPAR
jgi:predicted PurR-regulated permease PerM